MIRWTIWATDNQRLYEDRFNAPKPVSPWFGTAVPQPEGNFRLYPRVRDEVRYATLRSEDLYVDQQTAVVAYQTRMQAHLDRLQREIDDCREENRFVGDMLSREDAGPMYAEHVDPVLAETLQARFPKLFSNLYLVTDIYGESHRLTIGTETVYARFEGEPRSWEIDVDGSVPLVLWNPGKYRRIP